MKMYKTNNHLAELLPSSPPKLQYRETVLIPCVPTKVQQPWMADIALLFPFSYKSFITTVETGWLDVGKPFMVHENVINVLFLPVFNKKDEINIGKLQFTLREGRDICMEANGKKTYLVDANTNTDVLDAWMRYPGVIFTYGYSKVANISCSKNSKSF